MRMRAQAGLSSLINAKTFFTLDRGMSLMMRMQNLTRLTITSCPCSKIDLHTELSQGKSVCKLFKLTSFLLYEEDRGHCFVYHAR